MVSMRRTVTGTIDGDTFEIYTNINGLYKIRLADVNAPERYTSAGRQAMYILRGMIGGRVVTIRPVGRSYDRIVAEVFADGRSVNRRMKLRGY